MMVGQSDGVGLLLLLGGRAANRGRAVGRHAQRRLQDAELLAGVGLRLGELGLLRVDLVLRLLLLLRACGRQFQELLALVLLRLRAERAEALRGRRSAS